MHKRNSNKGRWKCKKPINHHEYKEVYVWNLGICICEYNT